MLDKPHKLETLPKWAQAYIQSLRIDIDHLETIKKMDRVMADRDWFTLPDPINGTNQDLLHLWVLYHDKPMPICSLGKGDMLFVGRAIKEK